MPFLTHLFTPCDVASMKTTLPSSRAHPQLYCVKIWSQFNWWFQSYWQFCTPPVAVQTYCQNVNLFHSIYFWYATHGLPGASSCTTPYVQLCCQQPDVSFAYSSASLRLGPEFARSRLRKNLIICSASWAKRAMPPWTDGYQQKKCTRMTLWSS